jgi:hypothetical protein
VYTLAKLLDATALGRGWIEISDLEELYPRSRRNLLRIINEGDGTFWRQDTDRDRLYLTSLEKLGKALGTVLGEAMYIDVAKISQLQIFKAYCYAAFYTRAKTISRWRLCQLYGVSRQTLVKWERLAGIQKTTNLGRKRVKELGDLEGLPGIDQDGVWKWGDALYWQLPNTFYLTDPDPAPRPTRCNRAIRHATYTDEPSAPVFSLYHSNRSKAVLGIARGEQTHAYVWTPGTLAGRRIWDYVHVLP